MAKFSYRQIIAEAWQITQSNKRIIRWYAIPPAFLTTLVGILYLIYQFYALKSSPLFEDWDQSFTSVMVRNVFLILKDNFSTLFPFVVVAAIIGVLYLLIPSFSQGALIQLIARKRNGQEIRIRDGMRYGMLSFLPLFEFSMLARTFSFISVLTWSSFLARNFSLEFLLSAMPFIIFYAIVGIILTLLFTYSEFFIVIDDRKVIESISKSSVLVVTHLERTLLLTLLMLIIGIRILLQILFVLLIPIVIIGVVYLIALTTLPVIAIAVGAVLGFILLYIASYLNATIHVFAVSVWTFTFLELTSEDYVSARDTSKTD
jgi:hypothetical protein